RIYGNYWYDKPAFFYWQLLAAFKIFGIHDFSARLFPVLTALTGIFVAYKFGCYLHNVKTGLVGAFMLATSLEYWYLGHAVVTDMTLFVSTSVCLFFFYIYYEKDKLLYLYGAFVAAAVGVLTKGPVGFVLPGLIILIFLLWEKKPSYFMRRHLWSGLLLCIILVLLWYVPMYRLHGTAFTETFLGTHNLLRATVSEHPQNNVIYYYAVVWMGGFFPWSLWALYEMIKTVKHKGLHLPQQSRARFLWVWLVVVFVFYQVMASKYLTYTFPILMPSALLLAPYAARREKVVRNIGVFTSLVLMAALFIYIVPMTHRDSAEDQMPFLQSLVTENTLILSYGLRYPASVVYYSGYRVERLETRDNVEAKRPRGMTWNDTNVMPFRAIEDIPDDRDILIISDETGDSVKSGELPGEWKEVGAQGRFTFFKRIHP
ncbi:MAG: glycosyltransferase family 39 protein, partial [Megasphaera micronuciformis]|nr:glycosyltransferase family 39 protein [Megasphaera micronuciformis]